MIIKFDKSVCCIAAAIPVALLLLFVDTFIGTIFPRTFLQVLFSRYPFCPLFFLCGQIGDRFLSRCPICPPGGQIVHRSDQRSPICPPIFSWWANCRPLFMSVYNMPTRWANSRPLSKSVHNLPTRWANCRPLFKSVHNLPTRWAHCRPLIKSVSNLPTRWAN